MHLQHQIQVGLVIIIRVNQLVSIKISIKDPIGLRYVHLLMGFGTFTYLTYLSLAFVLVGVLSPK